MLANGVEKKWTRYRWSTKLRGFSVRSSGYTHKLRGHVVKKRGYTVKIKHSTGRIK